MKMRYKFNCTILLTLVLGSLLFSSCEKQESHYALGDFIVSFGIVEKNIESDNSFLIHLDNGDKFVAVAASPYLNDLKLNQRVLVNFAPMEDKLSGDNTKTIYGKVNLVQNILYKSILQIPTANNDSLGKNPIIIRDSWVTGDSILTVDFSYLTEGSLHYVNLVKTAEGNGKDKPYIFEILHNARGDHQIYKASGFVSFKLDPFKIAGQHKTEFFVRYTDYEGKRIEIPHVINY